MADKQPKHIWSFDIGTGSLGYAVRGAKGDPFEFNKVDSLLIPDEFAKTKSAAERRRAYRTRLAHKKREEWLRKVFQEAGLEVLNGAEIVGSEGKEKLKSGDERLEREFPAKDDDTAYCGALLQMMLLQGEKLEEWQLYKAFHSAIQKRGFDKDIPWKNVAKTADRSGEKSEEENGEFTETAERATCIQKEIENISKDANHHHPCYWEAYRMGLWDPKLPDTYKVRIDHNAKSTHVGETKDPIAREKLNKEKKKGKAKEDIEWLPPTMAVYPRHMIEKQLRCMFKQAEKQYPALTGKEDYLLYGPAGEAYASYRAERKNPELYEKAGGRKELLRGKETDWQGILAQKIPTFDNRSPNKCALIPRLNVCRAAPKKVKNGGIVEDSLLSAQVTFLMKLKNIRFIAGGKTKSFTYEEIRTIFDERMSTINDNNQDKLEKEITKKLKLTKRELGNYICQYGGDCATPDNDKADAPKISGRSRFSRPALKIIKDIILSGKAPRQFLKENEKGLIAGNSDKRKGLIKEDLAFMERMGNSWDGLYIPNETLSEYKTIGEEDKQTREDAIQKVIADQNDPVVRHRLGIFHSQIKNMQAEFGTPDRVAIEFVREDWLSESRKKKYREHAKKREKANRDAQEELGEKNLSPSPENIRKWQLWKEQQERCIFCDRPIAMSESSGLRDAILFEDTEIAHIVPDSQGGPRAYINIVLACKGCNGNQGDRLPSDWLKREGIWNAFVERLNKMVKSKDRKFPKFKATLLSATNMEDAVKAADNRVKLQQTAWIAKLTQMIVCLHFGWKPDFEGEDRKVVVLSGGATNMVAQKYKLFELLNKGTNAKKDRDDKRHHALDAMILSFIPNWVRDSKKRLDFYLPSEVRKANPQRFFGSVLEQVMPHQICFDRPILRETIYGKREVDGEEQATYRVPLDSLAYTPKGQWKGLTKIKEGIKKICDIQIRKKVEKWVNGQEEVNEQKWKEYCKSFRLNKNTPFVKKVRVIDRDLTNYKDISKGQFGQFRTRKESEKGQFLYLDSKDKVRVKPVRVFESKHTVKKELESNPDVQKIFDFFHSKCLIEVTEAVMTKKNQKEISSGTYMLNTIRSNESIKMTSSKGKKCEGTLNSFIKEESDGEKKKFVLKKRKHE